MKYKNLFYLLLFVIVFSACKKSDSAPEPTKIDVSAQWVIDFVGLIISGPGDSQWRKKAFTAQEQNLFNSLDTASLVGTSTPDSVIEAPSIYNAPYPNPFVNFHNLSFRFINGFNGEYVVKYVVVDSLMNPLDKKVTRLQGNHTISIMPTLPVGRFRLYFTLSSAANPHFYKCWGNIQRTQ
jgi:hypothetical protein